MIFPTCKGETTPPPQHICAVGEDKGGGKSLPSIPSRKAGGEVVGGSSRKQEGEIKMVFPQSERGNDHW